MRQPSSLRTGTSYSTTPINAQLTITGLLKGLDRYLYFINLLAGSLTFSRIFTNVLPSENFIVCDFPSSVPRYLHIFSAKSFKQVYIDLHLKK